MGLWGHPKNDGKTRAHKNLPGALVPVEPGWSDLTGPPGHSPSCPLAFALSQQRPPPAAPPPHQRPPLRLLQRRQRTTTFSRTLIPPRASGSAWSPQRGLDALPAVPQSLHQGCTATASRASLAHWLS
jgi:hypothetical protein